MLKISDLRKRSMHLFSFQKLRLMRNESIEKELTGWLKISSGQSQMCYFESSKQRLTISLIKNNIANYAVLRRLIRLLIRIYSSMEKPNCLAILKMELILLKSALTALLESKTINKSQAIHLLIWQESWILDQSYSKVCNISSYIIVCLK